VLQLSDTVWVCEDVLSGRSWLRVFIGEGRFAAAIVLGSVGLGHTSCDALESLY